MASSNSGTAWSSCHENAGQHAVFVAHETLVSGVYPQAGFEAETAESARHLQRLAVPFQFITFGQGQDGP